MRKKILIPIAVLLALVGVGLLFFEPVSKEIGKAEAEKAVREFDEAVELIGFSEEEDAEPEKGGSKSKNKGEAESYPEDYTGPTKNDIRRLRADSLSYNKKLVNHQGTSSTRNYAKAALNLSDYNIQNNIYAYISAPTIDMKLPIYLGASDTMMSYGAAHMCYTSLPTGGVDTNCVIAGHTGFIGRVYFDNLSELHIGDELSVRNYWKRIDYKVIKKRVTDDKTVDYMHVVNGKSLLTLVTCVENSDGDFDRLVVTCEEI